MPGKGDGEQEEDGESGGGVMFAGCYILFSTKIPITNCIVIEENEQK